MEGTPFGRYRMVELLGRGGMGEVWRAFDTETKRIVAVKLLPASAADDPVFEERFRREAEAAAGLNDPHAVPIHHFGEIEGRLYVDMRLIEGRDLEVILADGSLDPARAVWIVEQIASALHAAHRIGLVHRDVKPSNILLTDDDFAYLIDFGIARTADDQPLTSTGMMIGTWAYMAPERFTTGVTDPRGDVYALACVLYQCLTGSPPFPGKSLEQQFAGHMTAHPPRPSRAGLHVPLGLDNVIARGMAKNPDHRYPGTKDLATAARTGLSASIAWPHRPTPTSARRRQTDDQVWRSNYKAAYPVLPAAQPAALDWPSTDPSSPTMRWHQPAAESRKSILWRRWRLVAAIVAVAGFVVSLIAAYSSTTVAPNPDVPKAVVYEVSGPTTATSIKYTDTGGVSRIEFTVSLPWQKAVSVAEGASNVLVVAPGPPDTTCSITVNGVEVYSQTNGGEAYCAVVR